MHGKTPCVKTAYAVTLTFSAVLLAYEGNWR